MWRPDREPVRLPPLIKGGTIGQVHFATRLETPGQVGTSRTSNLSLADEPVRSRETGKQENDGF
jgi:hypothetical protein